ncbi:MAG TPA: hypothetical protein VKP58_09595 [Candidatus Acidoferrum sp.]|nr:hypothetical protein [Candidatus Acidoferrum sp.]
MALRKWTVRRIWAASVFTLCLFLFLAQDLAHATPLRHAAREGAAQQESIPSPSSSYLFATQPLRDVRRSPDDLTEAERWALTVAEKRAAGECNRYLESFDKVQGEELFFLGQLCMLGNNPLATRESIRPYLEYSNGQHRKQAIELIAKASVKLGAITSAVQFTEQLLHEFGFDNDADELISYVIDGAEARDVTLSLGVSLSERRMALIDATIATKVSGDKSPADSGISVSRFLADGLTMCDLYRQSAEDQKAQQCLEKSAKLAEGSIQANQEELRAMQRSLARSAMIGIPSPIPTLDGVALLGGDQTVRTSVSLKTGHIFLFVFSLANPCINSCLEDLHSILQAANRGTIKLYALTTDELNGVSDSASKQQMMAALRQLHRSLSIPSRILVVPQKELESFRLDSFPSVIGISGNKVILCEPFERSAGTSARLKRIIKSATTTSIEQK